MRCTNIHGARQCDPVPILWTVADLWLTPGSTFTLETCKAVSHTWRRLACEERFHRCLTISVNTETAVVMKRTTAPVVKRLLFPSISDLSLHGLLLCDTALQPLLCLTSLRMVRLTYCTNLTTAVKSSLPSSVVELYVAGCHKMYRHLNDLSMFCLDIHVCKRALELVEEHSLSGFRFVDPALRLGVREGRCCLVGCSDAICPSIPDIHGRHRDPELWHASSFDWVEGSSQIALCDLCV